MRIFVTAKNHDLAIVVVTLFFPSLTLGSINQTLHHVITESSVKKEKK